MPHEDAATIRPSLTLLIAALTAFTSLGCVSESTDTAGATVALAAERGVSVPLNVGFLVRDGVYNTELTAPIDMFQHTVFHTDPGMVVFLVSPDGKEFRTFEGLRIRPDYSFDNSPPIDVLVVPSCEHSMDTDLEDERMIRFVRETAASARYIVSLCDGAFVLAQAGLLDGHQATTFPSDIDRLAERYTDVDVLRGPRFVHDGRLITSVGGISSFDVALYLCEVLYGPKTARGIAGGLVIDWNLDAVNHVVVQTPSQDS